MLWAATDGERKEPPRTWRCCGRGELLCEPQSAPLCSPRTFLEMVGFISAGKRRMQHSRSCREHPAMPRSGVMLPCANGFGDQGPLRLWLVGEDCIGQGGSAWTTGPGPPCLFLAPVFHLIVLSSSAAKRGSLLPSASCSQGLTRLVGPSGSSVGKAD